MYSQLRTIEQLYKDSAECAEKSQRLKSISDKLRQRSQHLKSNSDKLRQRSQHLKSNSNELHLRSQRLNNFVGTSEQNRSDLAPSVWMRGLLPSQVDERQLINQLQSDVAQRLQIVQQLQSKVDESFHKVSRLIKNRQLAVSASNTSEKTSDETDQKIILEKVYQLIDQIETGMWAENEETTASDSQRESLAAEILPENGLLFQLANR
jgi:uncharacterized coiled-coil DUF342 family protein